MHLHEGVMYKTRAGEKVGPLVRTDHREWVWEWEGVERFLDSTARWRADGSYRESDGDIAHPGDIVDVWPTKTNDPVSLTSERKNQHGDWYTQSTLADNLMFQLTHSTNWDRMGGERRQALFNIAQKMSRICTGDPYVEDHWDDIAGYAYLGKGGHSK